MIDIGANLTDDMFKGIYHGKQKHRNDLNDILKRSQEANVKTIIVTIGCLEELQEAKEIISQHMYLYYTLGIHPTRANTFNQQNVDMIKQEIVKQKNLLAQLSKGNEYFQQIIANIKEIPEFKANTTEYSPEIARWIFYGEFGLDYDRLYFASKEQQIISFKGQLPLALATGLPLFLHARGNGAVHDLLNAINDFYKNISSETKKSFKGVVHSFTGTIEEAHEIIHAGFYIGLNGCSFKDECGKKVLEAIGIDYILTETDCPYCGVKRTHEGYKYLNPTPEQRQKPEKFIEGQGTKDRSEPVDVSHIVQIIAKISSKTNDEVIQVVRKNFTEMIKGTAAEIIFQ